MRLRSLCFLKSPLVVLLSEQQQKKKKVSSHFFFSSRFPISALPAGEHEHEHHRPGSAERGPLHPRTASDERGAHGRCDRGKLPRFSCGVQRVWSSVRRPGSVLGLGVLKASGYWDLASLVARDGASLLAERSRGGAMSAKEQEDGGGKRKIPK